MFFIVSVFPAVACKYEVYRMAPTALPASSSCNRSGYFLLVLALTDENDPFWMSSQRSAGKEASTLRRKSRKTSWTFALRWVAIAHLTGVTNGIR